jgi:biotin operon repressor
MSVNSSNTPNKPEVKKEEKSRRVIIILLIFLLLSSLGYTYFAHQSSKASEKVLMDEKLLLMKDLNELKKSYEEAILTNEKVADELSLEKEKVIKLMEELKKSNLEIGSLRKYRAQAQELKLNMSHLVTENQMLKAMNTKLKVTVDSSLVELNKTEIKAKTLDKKVETLSKTVEKASVIKPLNLTFQAVSQRVSSKTKREAFTNRASKTSELKVCFNLPDNKVAKKAEMNFYVQISDSKNNVIGTREVATFDGKELIYSFHKIVKYEGENMEICEYVDVSRMKFEKGRYTAQLFQNGDFISKLDLILN